VGLTAHSGRGTIQADQGSAAGREKGRAQEGKAMKKQLYDVYTNGRNHILVWCDDQMELERMVQNDKIREYVLATTYKVGALEEIAE
jgi:hypothetical protein